MLFRRYKTMIITLLVLLMWTIYFPIWREQTLQDPMSVPISISPPGSIRAKFHIPVEERYFLGFFFDRAGLPREKISQVVGSGHNVPGQMGVSIPVRWEIYSTPDKKLVKKFEALSSNAYEWDTDAVARVISFIELSPGDYEISATVLEDTPDFVGFSTKIGIRLVSGKDAPISWQRSFILWFGLLYFEQIVWLLDIVLTIVLVQRIWNDRKWIS